MKKKSTKQIQGIIRDYMENLYSNILENLKEMDKFLDTYDHPKLNQEDINYLNRLITHNETEAAIKSLPKKKSSGPENKCMEARLGISLYSNLYLKLAKWYVFLIISYVFSSTKSENKR
jgi:hypothetical protein